MDARFLAAVLLGTPWLLSDSAQAAQYTTDPSHASVQFRILHLGFSTMTGRFDKSAGHFEWEETRPERASVEITIDTENINTNWADRDKHLREPRYLGVEAYPEATFKSTSYTGDANGGQLLGELTLHGVTRTLGIDIKRVGEGRDPWGDYRAGFDGTATPRRLRRRLRPRPHGRVHGVRPAHRGRPREVAPTSKISYPDDRARMPDEWSFGWPHSVATLPRNPRYLRDCKRSDVYDPYKQLFLR